MTIVSFKCPNCSGDMHFDPQSGNYMCHYCDSEFSQGWMDAHIQSIGLFQPAEDELQQYNCSSCGAEIMTDLTTAATFCYYCHNPVILSNRVSGNLLPDRIIPFRYNRKSAIQKFKNHVSKLKYLPDDFFSEEQIEKISGVYFPYWDWGATVHGRFEGEGTRATHRTLGDSRITETRFYDVVRGGIINFEHMVENALSKVNLDLAVGVIPYNYDDMVDFNMSYLTGFMAEKRDIEANSIKPGLEQKLEGYTINRLMDEGKKYDSLSARKKAVKVEKLEPKYCLLPVWTITYKGNDDKLYYYSMNGQTGKICGDFPVDKGKITKLKVKTFAIALAVLTALHVGGMVLWA